jgi:hypothetical protein
LKRAIERYVVYPLANLLATQQVRLGDLVRIDWDGVHKELTFVREREGAIITAEGEEAAAAAAVPFRDGLGKDTPADATAAPGDAPSLPALPAAAPATARQPLQGRKKSDS